MQHMDGQKRTVASLLGKLIIVSAMYGLPWACVAVAVESAVAAEGAARATSEPVHAKHPLAPALRIARASLAVIENAKDFEADLIKREVVGRRVSVHGMHIKLRHKPFSVYLRFFKPYEGREVLYVQGKNGGNLLAHETGLKRIAGTVALLPTGPEALSESRYPITRIGIANMVSGVIEQWEAEAKYGECQVKYYPNAKLGMVQCKVLQSSHPSPRRQFKFHMTRLYIEKKTGLPIRVEQYGFPARVGASPPMLEEYTYSNIKVDVGLRDIDFDVRNPEYDF